TDTTNIVQGGLPQVDSSSLAWGDYDNDGRLDFLLTGASSSGLIGKLYHNTGTAFVDASGIVQGGLPQVYYSSVAWGDYDNDGRLDFLLTGDNGSGYVSKLYQNTGTGFVDATNIVQGGLAGVYNASMAWGDYDNDGRLDFLLTGCTSYPCASDFSKLYHNTGS